MKFEKEKKLYNKNYGENLELSSKKRQKALELALDIRKFEIELYWKRATYFWAFIAASFAGYFALLSLEKSVPGLLILFSCLGLMFSLSWYLVNRGSKYWQNNWERHVDMLEDDYVGPLYKLTLEKSEYKKRNLLSEYPFSVSKINQILSLYIVFLWIIILGKSILEYFNIIDLDLNYFEINVIGVILLLLITFIFILLMIISANSSRKIENFRFSRRD